MNDKPETQAFIDGKMQNLTHKPETQTFPGPKPAEKSATAPASTGMSSTGVASVVAMLEPSLTALEGKAPFYVLVSGRNFIASLKRWEAAINGKVELEPKPETPKPTSMISASAAVKK